MDPNSTEPESWLVNVASYNDKLESDEKSIQCKIWPYKAKVTHTMKVHLEMNHIKLRFLCTLCAYNSCERYTLKNHLRDKHGIQLEESNNNTLNECGICLAKTSEILTKRPLCGCQYRLYMSITNFG